MERKAARGEWLGGRAPYGYRLNRETALLEPNETEAPVARLIFDLYTKKRLGARGVAKFLSHHGYRSRPGQLWSHVSVLNVLRNTAYVGKIAFRVTAATRAIATTRASRGTAMAGKAAAPTFCGRIVSTRRSWSLYWLRTRTRRWSAPPSSVVAHAPPSKGPTLRRRSGAWRQRSQATSQLCSATTTPSKTAGSPRLASRVE